MNFSTLLFQIGAVLALSICSFLFSMGMVGLRIYTICDDWDYNSDEEDTATPTHVCPVCLRKMQHAFGFSYIARYRALLEFYRRF